jgi:hypothetical protein
MGSIVYGKVQGRREVGGLIDVLINFVMESQPFNTGRYLPISLPPISLSLFSPSLPPISLSILSLPPSYLSLSILSLPPSYLSLSLFSPSLIRFLPPVPSLSIIYSSLSLPLFSLSFPLSLSLFRPILYIPLFQ